MSGLDGGLDAACWGRTWLCLYPPDMTVSRVIEPSSVPRWYASSWIGNTDESKT